MPKLPRISGSAAVGAFQRAGWELARQRGSHAICIEQIKAILFQLPEQELVALVADIEERLQTTAMSQLAKTGFLE